jgi:hypothetical protein
VQRHFYTARLQLLVKICCGSSLKKFVLIKGVFFLIFLQMEIDVNVHLKLINYYKLYSIIIKKKSFYMLNLRVGNGAAL